MFLIKFYNFRVLFRWQRHFENKQFNYDVILTYTANFATYKINMKFIYITYEKYVISTHESYTHEFHMNVHACNMYEFCIYFIYIKLHIKYICTIYVNFIYITYIFHTFTKYICITYEFFHAYYIYKI